MAEQYTRNPKKLIDQIERETRERLEPLIEQAQVRQVLTQAYPSDCPTKKLVLNLINVDSPLNTAQC